MNHILKPNALLPLGNRSKQKSIETTHAPQNTLQRNHRSSHKNQLQPIQNGNYAANNNTNCRKSDSNKGSSLPRSGSVQGIAMNLSANAFMNSTTKFVKGLDIGQIQSNLKATVNEHKRKAGHNRTNSLEPPGNPIQSKKSTTPDKPFFTAAFGSKGLPSQVKIDSILNPIKASLGIRTDKKSKSSLSNSSLRQSRLRSGIKRDRSKSRSRSSSNTNHFSRTSSKRVLKFSHNHRQKNTEVKSNQSNPKPAPRGLSRQEVKYQAQTEAKRNSLSPQKRQVPTTKPQNQKPIQNAKQANQKPLKAFARRNDPAPANRKQRQRNRLNLDRSNTLPHDQSLGTVSKVSPEHLEAMKKQASPKKDANNNQNRSVEVKNTAKNNEKIRPVTRLGYANKQTGQNSQLHATPPKQTTATVKATVPTIQRQRQPSPKPGQRQVQPQPKPMTQKPNVSKTNQASQLQQKSKVQESSAALVCPKAKLAKPQPMPIVKSQTKTKKDAEDFPRLWNNEKSESRLHLLRKSPPAPEQQQVKEKSSKIVSPRNGTRPVKFPAGQAQAQQDASVSLRSNNVGGNKSPGNKITQQMKSTLKTQQVKPQPMLNAKKSPASKQIDSASSIEQPVITQPKFTNPQSRIATKAEQPSMLRSSASPSSTIKPIVKNKTQPSEVIKYEPSKHALTSMQNTLAFAAAKVCRQFQQRAFDRIRQRTKFTIPKQRQAQILLRIAATLNTSLTNTWLKIGLSQLKKQWLAHSQNKKPIYDQTVSRNIAANILSHIVSLIKRNRVRNGLRALQRQKQLGMISAVGSKDYFKSKRVPSDQELLPIKLTALVSIIRAYQHSHVRPHFNRLFLESMSQKSSGSNKAIPQKASATRVKTQPDSNKTISSLKDFDSQRKTLIASKKQLQSQVSAIEGSIFKQKRGTDSEKRKLQKTLEQIKDVFRILSEDVETKRLRSKEWQRKIEDILHHKADFKEQIAPQNKELINKLTKCYALVYKAKDWVAIEDLQTLLGGEIQQGAKVVKEWIALAQNKRLLAQIAPYEGQVSVGPSRRLLLQDQALALQKMRSYVKQRYWWEWVSLAVKTLPS